MPMSVGEIHPTIPDLEAFTLGTLDEAAHAAIEVHVASCSFCQERAAGGAGDTFVSLLRRANARMAGLTVIAEPSISDLPRKRLFGPVGVVLVLIFVLCLTAFGVYRFLTKPESSRQVPVAPAALDKP
jgi:hypothetical protein